MNDEKIAVSKKYLIFLQRQSWRLIITMQAAYIDHHQGADDAIKWIVKTLRSDVLFPEKIYELTAQEFFDREMEEIEAAIKERYGNQE